MPSLEPHLTINTLLVTLLHFCSLISEDWSQHWMSGLNDSRVRLDFHFYFKSKPGL